MVKLTRLNNNTIAINPDHIGWVEALPDTTLFLIGGEKMVVRETLDELVERVVEYRRAVRQGTADSANELLGDPPRILPQPRVSEIPKRPSWGPYSRRGV
jgi:flagellar protein FlbD